MSASGSAVVNGEDSIHRPGGAALPTPDATALSTRSEPLDRSTIALPSMVITPPDSSAVFCSNVQVTNSAIPPDAKTAPPRRAKLPVKMV
eukprot:2486394-Prymnesium_polylepis.1